MIYIFLYCNMIYNINFLKLKQMSSLPSRRNPKKVGFWVWVWVYRPKLNTQPKSPKPPKTQTQHPTQKSQIFWVYKILKACIFIYSTVLPCGVRLHSGSSAPRLPSKKIKDTELPFPRSLAAELPAFEEFGCRTL